MAAIKRLTGGGEPLTDPLCDGIERQGGVGRSVDLWDVRHVALLCDRKTTRSGKAPGECINIP
jgi:hypothetical protein